MEKFWGRDCWPVIGMERGWWRVVRMGKWGFGMLGESSCCLGTLGCGINAMHEYAFTERLVQLIADALASLR